MFDCDYQKECEEYLNGDLELPIAKKITKKPVCDPLGCPIFLYLEMKGYQSFLDSPLYEEINATLSEQATKEAEILNKALTKEFLIGK